MTLTLTLTLTLALALALALALTLTLNPNPNPDPNPNQVDIARWNAGHQQWKDQQWSRVIKIEGNEGLVRDPRP